MNYFGTVYLERVMCFNIVLMFGSDKNVKTKKKLIDWRIFTTQKQRGKPHEKVTHLKAL